MNTATTDTAPKTTTTDSSRTKALQAASPQVRTDPQWLAAHWMPFTGNRQFKRDPRIITSASGAWFTDQHGRHIFDGLSGLWCTGLGHGRREIAEAVGRQALALDYSPGFQFGHPLSFELANMIVERMPEGYDLYTQCVAARRLSCAMPSSIFEFNRRNGT